jgi:cytochrome b561
MTTASSPAPVARYTGVAIALHWLIAVLIGANLLLIWWVDDWPKDWERPIIDLHKSIGLTVLGLVLLRILWRLGHPAPPLPETYSRWERIAAHAAHIGLYLLILAIPLSGWIHDSAWKGGPTHPLTLFGVIPWFRIPMIANQDPDTKEKLHSLFFAMHQTLAWVLYGLFILHVGGALKHQWFDKEPELQRMLP